jgi:hypothetical protein
VWPLNGDSADFKAAVEMFCSKLPTVGVWDRAAVRAVANDRSELRSGRSSRDESNSGYEQVDPQTDVRFSARIWKTAILSTSRTTHAFNHHPQMAVSR